MSNMSSTNKRYEEAEKKYQDSYNQYQDTMKKYSGEAGLNSATEYAKQQAAEQAEAQSGRAGANAGTNAVRSARSAGLSKAQSALMGEKAAADTTGNAYNSIYNNTYGQGLTTAVQNNQATVDQSGRAMDSRLQATNLASTEGQNAYNRSWGNLGGWLSTGSALLGASGGLSDERLKKFKDVSSKIGQKEEPCDKETDYDLLKVTYTKKKKE